MVELKTAELRPLIRFQPTMLPRSDSFTKISRGNLAHLLNTAVTTTPYSLPPRWKISGKNSPCGERRDGSFGAPKSTGCGREAPLQAQPAVPPLFEGT